MSNKRVLRSTSKGNTKIDIGVTPTPKFNEFVIDTTKFQKTKYLDKTSLYFIVGRITNRVKIGRAQRVFDRLAQMQASSPDELDVYAFAPNCGLFESNVHRHFEEYRLHGEWFAPAVLAALQRQAVLPTEPPRSWSAENDELVVWIRGVVELQGDEWPF